MAEPCVECEALKAKNAELIVALEKLLKAVESGDRMGYMIDVAREALWKAHVKS